LKWPGRFEWKILGAMVLVGALSMGTGLYALRFYLRNFTRATIMHQREAGQSLAQAAEVFRAYFSDRKDDFRRQAASIASFRPQRMSQLDGVSGLMRARLLRAGVVLDEWAVPQARSERMRAGPPILTALPLAYGERRPEKILELTFGIPMEMYTDFLELREAMDHEQELDRAFASVVPRVLRQYTTFALIAFALPPLLGFFVARRATQRVRRLRDAAAQVGAGDLSVRVTPRGRDEVDDLGRAFDSMVSELAEARSRLSYIQKVEAWQEVARRLAHEIKNPLTPIQLAVQELVSRYDGADQRYERLLKTADEILHEEITSLRRLVDDFSAFAKLSRAQPLSLDLGELVQEFVRQNPAFARYTRAVTPAKPIFALCDKVLFRRVLSNLVENAVQAAESISKRPEIVVTVKTSGDGRARVVVDDNGPGVPDADKHRIFDPYVTNKEGGTGLGLAIVRKIIIDHGGDIRLAGGASALGGARFEVLIPMDPPAD